MKKIYQNPEIKVVNIQTSHMMAGSPGYGGQTTQTSGNFAKGGMFWSDEEDEDYYDEEQLPRSEETETDLVSQDT